MATQTKQTPVQPTHRLYCVSGEGKASNWTPIGAAWPNRDGEGFSIKWDAIPVSGRLVMRRIKPRDRQREAA